MSTESDVTTFNNLMRQAYRTDPKLFAKLMGSPGTRREDPGRRIYLEMIRSSNAITATDLIKRGYKEPTVYRCLKNLKQIGLITFGETKRISKMGPRRIFLWRIR